MKEAKTYACKHKSVTSSLHASEEAGKEHLGETRTKPKNSWKTSIFPWLKADNKHIKTHVVEEQPPSKASLSKSKASRGYASGSIKGCTPGRPKTTTSGPLTGVFNQRKGTTEEFQMPYVSLGKLNRIQSYGPVYLVT